MGLSRRRIAEDHPALEQVDRLLSGSPPELEVPVSGLPGQLGRLLAIYEGLFQLRNYAIVDVDSRLDDLWIARIERLEIRKLRAGNAVARTIAETVPTSMGAPSPIRPATSPSPEAHAKERGTP